MDRLRIVVGYVVTGVWSLTFTAGTFGADVPVAEATAVMLPVAAYLFWRGGNGERNGA